MTPRETELKLGFAPETLARIDQDLVLRQCGPGKILHAIYYDTEAGALAAAGFTLRVREEAGRHSQTLKTRAPPVGGLAVRGEWTWAIKSAAPEAMLLAATPAARIVGDAALMPMFATRVTRRAFVLTVAPGTEVAVAIDTGAIEAGDRRLPVGEIELELLAGPREALLSLAEGLNDRLGLWLEPEAKAERGWRLALGGVPAVMAPRLPRLRRDCSVRAGFAGMLRAGVDGLVGNLAAARAGVPEGVHQMRVATRWLRAGLALFAPVLAGRAVTAEVAGLRALGRALGAVRDWDVFCDETLAAAMPGAACAAKAATLRAEAREALVAHLADTAVTGLVLGLARWAEAPGLARTRLRDVAPALLARRWRKFRRRARHLPRQGPAARHEARKALKTFQEGARFLAALYPGRGARAWLRAGKAVQRALGRGNDVTQARRMAAMLGATAAMTGWADAEAALAQAALKRGWKRLRRLEKRGLFTEG